MTPGGGCWADTLCIYQLTYDTVLMVPSFCFEVDIVSLVPSFQGGYAIRRPALQHKLIKYLDQKKTIRMRRDLK